MITIAERFAGRKHDSNTGQEIAWNLDRAPSRRLNRGVFVAAGASPRIYGSYLIGDPLGSAILLDAGASASLAHTQLEGGASGTPAAFNCIGVFDESFAALDENCE